MGRWKRRNFPSTTTEEGAETRFAVAFEIVDRGVQPERFSQIELDADFIQRAENLVGPCISRGIADDGVLQQAIILE